LNGNDLWSRYLVRWVTLPLSRSSSTVKVTDHSSKSHDETASTAMASTSPHGECVHCWRPLANDIILRQKCTLTECYAKVVGATSSERFVLCLKLVSNVNEAPLMNVCGTQTQRVTMLTYFHLLWSWTTDESCHLTARFLK